MLLGQVNTDPINDVEFSLSALLVLHDEYGDDFHDLFLLPAWEFRDFFKNLVHLGMLCKQQHAGPAEATKGDSGLPACTPCPGLPSMLVHTTSYPA